MSIESRNPFSGKIIQTFEEETDRQVLEKIKLADSTYQRWKTTNFTHRKELMLKTAVLLRDRKARYGDLMTKEMGKSKREAIGEIEKCALACDYYAENAENFLSDHQLDVPDGEA
jgi:succinate-semialdehyde dehydrogenase/glutarate-semialdehyde dehydrogenase